MIETNSKKPVLCVILDGWGIGPAWGGNAVSQSRTKNFDLLMQNYPSTILLASGADVGLPENAPGNSEAGHLNIGAGKMVHQDTVLIEKNVASGDFLKNRIISDSINHSRKFNSNIHVMGLLSKAGTHSDIKYLYPLLGLLKSNGVSKAYIHLFSDGRDSPPMSGIEMIEQVEKKLEEIGLGSICSISGRFYAMDRDNHWGRIIRVYNMLVKSESEVFKSARQAFSNSYAAGLTDEFVVPRIIANDTQQIVPIKSNDAIILFNFRSDRTRELTQAFLSPKINEFPDRVKLNNLFFASFVTYDETNLAKQVFEPEQISHPIARIWSEKGLSQYHTAETEKYAHVTYYLNGGAEKPFNKEDRLMIPSPKTFPTYDYCPEMSAGKVTQTLVNAIKRNKYDCMVANFANPDMVGHTGNLRATVQAIEYVDKCLGEVLSALLNNFGTAFIFADHGNAEQMVNPRTGNPDTEHTVNPVPFIFFSNDQRNKTMKLKNGGKLSSVAPTILDFMGIEKSSLMTESSLLLRC